MKPTNGSSKSSKPNEALDASDILAPNELENSDLLKDDNFSFDLASKSSLFMSTTNGDLDFTLPNTITSPNTPKKIGKKIYDIDRCVLFATSSLYLVLFCVFVFENFFNNLIERNK